MTATDSILTMTVMKNEGPFMLEWVAWQRVIGVDHILIMTNDCDDGTDAIADRLAELGGVTHVPNPAAMGTKVIGKARHPHIVGLEYAKLFPQWRNAGYVLLCDVDEFPDLRVGNGTIPELIEKTGGADVISLCEKLYGADEHITYDERSLIERFSRCSSLAPGKWRARRGLKSICRNDPRINIRNHRPLVSEADAQNIKWVDGAGEPFPMEFRSVHEKGIDCRGRYTLGGINHYSLRTMESFLVKVARGDAVAQDNDRVDYMYFKQRNKIDSEDTHIRRKLPELREALAALMADDRIAELHWQAVRHHRRRIHELKERPEYRDLFNRILGRIEATREQKIKKGIDVPDTPIPQI